MLSYNEYADIIETAVNNIHLPKEPARLYDPIRYTLEGGGKRIRPVLTIAACQACKADPEKAINQALAIEMFHNFTLLHDDVMDNADMRRGRPTVHIRWNTSTAILSGDTMLTLASSLVNRGVNSDVASKAQELFNRTAIEVYEGQQLDMDFEDRLDVTEGEYINMIRLKTSVLLGCACKMGAIVAEAAEECQQALYNYGVLLGLAFQLRDDLLDTYGDPIVFGKRVGGDILNDKKTWLLINALREDTTGELVNIIKSGKPDDEEKIIAVKNIYERLGLRSRCEQVIVEYVEQAIKIINNIDGLSSSAKEFFIELAHRTVMRTN